jgi:predicted porin
MGAPPAWAQDAKDREIQELRQRLDRLEKEIGVKKEAPPAPAAAPAPGAPAAPAEAPQSIGDRIKTIEETIKSTPLFGVIKDWNFGGHVALSYNYNFNNPDSRNNAFRVFDDKANQFDINQAELWIDKPTSVESPIGFGIDFIIGRDAKKIHSLGLGISAGDDATKSDVFDLTQAYVTYKAPIGNGLDLKAGKFVTLHGAEVIRRTGNFNISRSLAFGFAIPFTHTGIMATYPFTDWLTVMGGIVNGWDNTDDNNNDKSFHGMITITPLKDLTVIIGGTWGSEARFAGDDANGPKRGLLDLVAIYKPIPPLTLTLNYDYGEQDEAFGPGSQTARWHAIAGYATYDLTDKFSVGIRGEYFRDEEGFRLSFTDPDTDLPARLNVWEITLTARYKLLDHLFASLEFRHDEATNGRLVFDDNGLDSITGLQKKSDSQNTIAVELVYQF